MRSENETPEQAELLHRIAYYKGDVKLLRKRLTKRLKQLRELRDELKKIDDKEVKLG